MIDEENRFDDDIDDQAPNPALYDGLDDDDTVKETDDGGTQSVTEQSSPEPGTESSSESNGDDEEKRRASEKQILESQRNSAPFLSRQTIVMAVGGGIVLMVFVALVIAPMFKTNKKKEQTLKLGTSSAVPQEITNWHPVTNPYDPFSRDSDTEPADPKEEADVLAEIVAVTDSKEEKKEETKFTDTYQPTRTAAPSGYSSTRQETNRNEQQKSTMRMKINDDYGVQNNAGNVGAVTSQPYMSGMQGLSGTGNMAGGTGLASSLIDSLPSVLNRNNYEQQNGQQGKQSFMSNGSGKVSFQWNGEYSLDYGTIITATLVTGINTDLPGLIIARVVSNVWSSGGQHILIPAGTRVFATYNSSVTYGQRRIQIAWNKMIRPDGLEIDLGNFPGVDSQGFSGSDAQTKLHALEYMKAFGLIGAFSVLDAEIEKATKNKKDNTIQLATSNMYSEMSKIGEKIIDRALDIQPTLVIPQGAQVNIITNVSMMLPPFEQNLPDKRYVRQSR